MVVSLDRTDVRPGEQIILQADIDIEPGWHIYSSDFSGLGPVPTHFELDDSAKVSATGPFQEPPSKRVWDEGFEIEVGWHSGSLKVRQAMALAGDLPAGPMTLDGQFVYMACTESHCLPPMYQRFNFQLQVEQGPVRDAYAFRPAKPALAAAPSIESPSSTSQPTIAILDFEGIGVSAQEARVLTNRLGTHVVQLGRYQVIERGQMEQILQEQDFQLTGCTSNECAVEIGQLIGAQQMLAGSFGQLGTVYTIDMRIIDVVTGRITRTTSYDIEGSINRLLSEGLAEAVRRIAGSN